MNASEANESGGFARTCTLTDAELAAYLPFPERTAHKYSRGKLIAFAGSRAYPGAALLAADAAAACGAGYVQVATAKCVIPLVIAHRPSIVASARKDWKPAMFAAAREGRPCAYLVGSGFDAEAPSCKRHLTKVLECAKAPVLVDGGALSALPLEQPFALISKRAGQGLPTILTPHAGEAAKLAATLGDSSPSETPDSGSLAEELARQYRSIVVLKGAVTYVSDGKQTYCMDKGTSALAKAGTGDVLAGMIAAFLAQGIEPFAACALGVRLHALAGCEAAMRRTSISVTAEDVVEEIPQAIKTLHKCARSKA